MVKFRRANWVYDINKLVKLIGIPLLKSLILEKYRKKRDPSKNGREINYSKIKKHPVYNNCKIKLNHSLWTSPNNLEKRIVHQ